MAWIRSLGGNLMVLPAAALAEWPGSYGPGGSTGVAEEQTPYWAVSEQVTDYAGTFGVAGREALVLANGPSPTAFVPAHRLFVQQLATTPGVDPIAGAVAALPAVEWEQEVLWACDGDGVLFDSAAYGPAVTPEQTLPVPLEAGKYAVRSAYREPDDSSPLWMVLTQLVPAA